MDTKFHVKVECDAHGLSLIANIIGSSPKSFSMFEATGRASGPAQFFQQTPKPVENALQVVEPVKVGQTLIIERGFPNGVPEGEAVVTSVSTVESEIKPVSRKSSMGVKHVHTRPRAWVFPSVEKDESTFTTNRLIATAIYNCVDSTITVGEAYKYMAGYGFDRGTASKSISRCLHNGWIIKKGEKQRDRNNRISMTMQGVKVLAAFTESELQTLYDKNFDLIQYIRRRDEGKGNV